MNPIPELVAAVQLDRERSIRAGALARVAALVRDCCRISRLDRLVRFLRPAAAGR